MMSTRILALFLTVIVVVSGAIGGVAVASADDGADSPAADTISISLERPGGSVGANHRFSESPSVNFSEDIAFQNGSAYQLVIYDADTGASLTLEANGTYTVNSSSDFILHLWGSYGDLLQPVDVGSDTTGHIDGGMEVVNSTGDFTTTGVVNISVGLVDSSSGGEIARTDTGPYVLAHRYVPRQNATDGTVQLSIPRGDFPKDTPVQVAVFNSSVIGPYWTDDSTTVNLSYDPSRDTFTGVMDASAVDGGVYGWELQTSVYGHDYTKSVHGDTYSEGDSSPYLLYFDRDRPGETVHEVPSEYGSIQDAIDAADRGDTVVVAEGIYGETVRIDKSITLLGDTGGSEPGPGPNAPVLTGNGEVGTGVVIAPDVFDVRVQGFEIRNYAHNESGAGYGINSHSVDDGNIRVTDNYIHNIGWTAVVANPGTEGAQHQNWVVSGNVIADFNAFGVRIPNADDTVITNNRVTGTAGWPEWVNSTTSNVGILVEAKKRGTAPLVSHSTLIANNTVNGSLGLGISAVAWNTLDEGTAVMDDLSIRSNTVGGNISYAGVQTRTRNTATLRDATVRDNEIQTNYIGFLAQATATSPYYETVVENNTISQSRYGVGSVREHSVGQLTITENTLSNNSNGVGIAPNTEATNVTVTHNAITNNSQYGVLNGGNGELNATRNWWGAFDGPRANFSGSGDAISENVTVEPYYVDAAMTTLSDTPASLAIQGLPQSISVNKSQTVTLTVTDERTDDAVGDAQVSLTGAGVNVSRPTNASGVATFDVNASKSGKINVSATKEGYTETTATIQVSENGANPTLPGFDNPAGDTDADGTLEDVNGNGNFDIGDIQALYTNRNSDAVQNNVDKFDFNNNTVIDIGDVQALYVEYLDS